jgi:Winged helix DNA-binding domain
VNGAPLRAARARSQMLDGRARDAAALVGHLVGVQAQDTRAAALSIRARTDGVEAAAVERAIATDRSIVRLWAMRGTLHLVAAEDSRWLHDLLAPLQMPGEQRALDVLEVPHGERPGAVAAIRRALAHGPLTRAELTEALERAGIDASGRRAAHLPRLAALEGHVCFGPPRGGKDTSVLAADWLGDRPRLARDASLAELARRYVAAYGPAEPRDLAAWAGLTLRDARAGWERAAPGLAETDGGWVIRGARARLDEPAPDPPLVRLVPAFDTYLLGYRDRGFAVAPEHAGRVWPGGGIVRATVLENGAAAGVWRLRSAGRRRVLEVEPFGEPPAVGAEADAIARFLGVPVEVSPAPGTSAPRTTRSRS